MSLRLEMLQAARRAPRHLGESSGLVRTFLLHQQNPDGGFRDRAGRSDLYYTVYGLAGLAAVQLPGENPGPHAATRTQGLGARAEGSEAFPPYAGQGVVVQAVGRTVHYLQAFGTGEGLDFVHVCCLARCWGACLEAGTEVGLDPETRSGILRAIERYRSRDGGYHPIPDSDCGTAYGAFLALGAYQDLGAEIGGRQRLAGSLRHLETSDGAWTNEPPSGSRLGPAQAGGRTPQPVGATNATAAAVALLRNLGAPVPVSAAPWLLARAHPQGGFRASPAAPMPDLLSTATALHALAGLQASLEPIRESCLDFLDTLWTNEGGFHGHWDDHQLDCEYTFYGLLALGHLSR